VEEHINYGSSGRVGGFIAETFQVWQIYNCSILKKLNISYRYYPDEPTHKAVFLIDEHDCRV
jgi:hypothetical protein